MISIDVILESNLWRKKIKKANVFFNSLVKVFPKKYRFIEKKIGLTILLSNNKNIKKLNKKFRSKNKATDVLSFPSEKKINIKKSPYIGDIVISYDFINKPKTLSVPEFKNKVTKIFIHGFLHLLGYDHIKLKDFKVMLIEEEKIYQTIKKKITQIV
jgi:probable rRNA maturation factor